MCNNKLFVKLANISNYLLLFSCLIWNSTTVAEPSAQASGKTAGATPPAQASGKTAGATSPVQASGKTAGATPPAQASGKIAGATPPVQASGKIAGATSPVQASGKIAGATSPVQASGKTAVATPPAQASGKTAGVTPPAQTSGKTAGVTPPVQASGKTAGSTPPAQASGKTAGATSPVQASAKKPAVTIATGKVKSLAPNIKAGKYIDEIAKSFDEGEDLKTAGFDTDDLFKALDTASSDTEAKAKITKVLEFAGEKATNKEEFLDYIAPDSSNPQVTSSYSTSNKLVNQLNSRIASKSNSFNKFKLQRAGKGINSGAVTDSFDIWATAGYSYGRDSSNKDKQDYSKLNVWAISLGLDTNAYEDVTLGASYAYNNSKVQSYGARKGKLKAENKISTHAVAAYTGTSVASMDVNIAVIYARSSYEPTENTVSYKDYNSNMLCLTTMATYPMQDLAVSGQLGFTSVMVAEHQTKLALVEKKTTNIISAGAGVKFCNSVIASEDVLFDCNLDLRYKLAKILGDNDTTTINLVANDDDTGLPLKPRVPDMHSLSADLLLKLQLHKKLNFDLDINYTYGRHSNQYGASFTVRYLL